MPSDQEIREICVRVSLAADAEQFKAAVTELKIAMLEHASGDENLSIHLLNRPKPVKDQKDGTGD